MRSEFRLPALGADMDEGTILEWHVAPGACVKRGDVVAVVETDKGAIDVEIFLDGVVREIVVAPGTKVPVGTVLALLETEGEATAAAQPEQRQAAPVAAPAAADRVRVEPAAGALDRVKISRPPAAARTNWTWRWARCMAPVPA